MADAIDRYLACDVDRLIEQSLVRLALADAQQPLGTGFVVAPRRVVTCFHVVQRGGHLVAKGADGEANVQRHIRVEGASAEGEPDIAILELDGDVAPPLPVAAIDVPSSTALAGRGYGLPDTGYLDSHPFELTVRGRAAVRYRSDGVALSDALDMTGDGVGPGTSGAPLVDISSRVGVAMVVGGNAEPEVARTWAVALAAATHNAAFRELLAWNDRELPRLGAAINARAAQVLFAAGGRAGIDALLQERRFEPSLNVPREQAIALLARFMEAREPLLAIVGPSNVGKSWLLASLASTLLDGPHPASLLMFEARTIGRNAPALEALVQERLAQGMARAYPKAAAAGGHDRAAAALAASGARMTFVIDGLNEAPDGQWLGSHWLPQAVHWCNDHGARLIVSCRSETWPILADIAGLDRSLFFLPDRSGASDAPADWCFTLSDFSDAESALAARRYGLDPGRHEEVGPHPLMFRVARALNDTERDTVAAGRFRMLDRYVERQSRRVLSRLGKGATAMQGMFGSLRRLADALPPGGEGAIARVDAATMFASEDVFDMLVDEGILSAADGHVRYRFDQLADVLRTPKVFAPGEFLQLADADLEQAAARAASAVLRFDADANEDAYRSTLDAFVAAIEAGGQTILLEQAERIARSLPAGRNGDIKRIYRMICERSNDSGSFEASRSIAEAPLPVAVRVQLLLDRAVLTYASRDGYPLRWKDWAEPSRRHAFLPTWGGGDEPQKFLYALLLAHREDVRKALAARLGDPTRIGKEAWVGSLASGLLFIDAETDYEALFRLVLSHREIGTARNLLRELFELDRERAAALVLESASSAQLDEATADLLLFVDWQASSPVTHAAVLRAYRALPHSDPPTDLARTLAHRVWTFDRSDLAVWDVATAVWSAYGSAPEIPPERFDIVTDRIAASGVAYARYALTWDESDEAQQRRFAQALRTNLESGGEPYGLGLLLESRLDRFDGTHAQRPWLELASQIVRDREQPAFDTLEFSALHTSVRRSWSDTLLEILVGDPRSVADARTLASALARMEVDSGVWRTWIALLRTHHTEAVDDELWSRLGVWHSLERYAPRPLEHAGALVDLWRTAASQSTTSRAVQADVAAGHTLEELLARQP